MGYSQYRLERYGIQNPYQARMAWQWVYPSFSKSICTTEGLFLSLFLPNNGLFFVLVKLLGLASRDLYFIIHILYKWSTKKISRSQQRNYHRVSSSENLIKVHRQWHTWHQCWAPMPPNQITVQSQILRDLPLQKQSGRSLFHFYSLCKNRKRKRKRNSTSDIFYSIRASQFTRREVGLGRFSAKAVGVFT